MRQDGTPTDEEGGCSIAKSPSRRRAPGPAQFSIGKTYRSSRLSTAILLVHSPGSDGCRNQSWVSSLLDSSVYMLRRSRLLVRNCFSTCGSSDEEMVLHFCYTLISKTKKESEKAVFFLDSQHSNQPTFSKAHVLLYCLFLPLSNPDPCNCTVVGLMDGRLALKIHINFYAFRSPT